MKRDLHPGGNEVLQKYAGKDATESFSVLHSDDAWSELEQIVSNWFDKTQFHSKNF